jgi:SNF2 family DNA or RNA helicase
LGGTGINLIAANHVVITQKFWNMNEQKQAIARIHRIGQRRKPTAWILHCRGGIDDRISELQLANGRFEARLMHSLMDSNLTYEQLMDVRAARQAQHQQK